MQNVISMQVLGKESISEKVIYKEIDLLPW